MWKEMIETAEIGLSSLMSALKFHINDYCDLETTHGNAFVAKDSSMGTILRYDGFRSLIGRSEYARFIEDLANGLEPFLTNRGHQIQVVYFRDGDPEDELRRLLQPAYETCATLELDLVDLLDEKMEVYRALCMNEQVFLVLWTRPSVLDPVEVRLSAQETREMISAYKLPSMVDAQNLLRPNRFMIDRHETYAQKVVDLIRQLNGAVAEVEVHEAFCEMKRYLYRDSTPPTWRPALAGDRITARWKTSKRKHDVSELSYPRLEDQLFASPAVNGNKEGDGGLTDTRACRIGNRIFAPVMVKIPPQRPQSFTALFQALNSATTKTSGNTKPIPWSISFMIEGDGLKGIALRKMFAGILGITSASNRNLVKSANALARYKESGGAVVKFQVNAVTWAAWGEEKELLIRRSKLARALAGWGNATTEEETGDATAGVMSCVPGLLLNPIAPASAPPLHDAAYMLPLSRPASPFFQGQSPYRTLDGKILPWETFSDQQNTWISLFFGGPGSGKSVEANRRNEEMCLIGGLTRLPYIGIIDIGVSSSGFISLIEDALPLHMKHLALYVRVQNTEQYCVNQFDTQLGSRKPLAREREYMKNYLVALVTPPERGKAHTYMPEFCGRVIDEAFRNRSDQNERGSPSEFSPNHNPWLKEQITKAGIHYQEATKWWEIVDMLFERGMFYAASVAQRYAVPTLFDMVQAGANPDIKKDFEAAMDNGMSVFDEFQLMIKSASSDFPVFAGVTQFDVGESRVMAIDLQDVVTTGSRAAEKQAALMYMMAINAFMRKVNVCKEDLDSLNIKYRGYHTKRVEELSEDFKRLFVDEYHKTGNNPQLRESFMIYGRESRKWGLELVLASQLPLDFAELANIATTTIIMDAGNEQTRSQIREVFGLSDTEISALKNFVHGPQRGIGTTFLAKLRTKDKELSQLFTSTCGGMELWALATTMEDRGLRGLLYSQIPKGDARKVLKKRFPSGSCKSYVDQHKLKSKEELGEGFVDEEVTESVIQKLASELLDEYRTSREAALAISAAQRDYGKGVRGSGRKEISRPRV